MAWFIVGQLSFIGTYVKPNKTVFTDVVFVAPYAVRTYDPSTHNPLMFCWQQVVTGYRVTKILL